MAVEVILPRVDMDMATGQIARWHVEEGGTVEKGQVLFEIETDKAAMEIEAPASGVLRDVSAAEGVTVPVGATVAWIAAPGETIEAAGTTVSARQAEALPQAAPAPSAEPPPHGPAGSERGLRATPLARRLARQNGLDLAALTGSGPHGRVVSKDVIKAVEAPAVAVPGGSARDISAPQSPAVQLPAVSAVVPVATPSAEGGLNRVWLRRGEGDPLVLIHGFGADLDVWRPVLAGWQVQRPVLGIDLPGHGKSALQGEVSLDGFTLAVDAALAAEGIASLHLVGHSLGGAVAATLATLAAREIRSLFLIAPAGLGPQINGGFIDGFARAREAAALSAWMGELVADPSVLTPALVKATARQREDERHGDALQRIAGRLFPDGTQAMSIRRALERLAMPAKIVFGADDRIIPARQARGLPGTIGQHLFPGIGHMPQIEAREPVTRLLDELLRSAG